MTETVRMLEHKGGHLRNLNNQEKSASSASKKSIVTHPLGGSCLHAAHHSDARSDSRQNRDECLNHQFPNVSLFHSSNYNLPFTMYNSLIQFPSLTGRVREGLFPPFDRSHCKDTKSYPGMSRGIPVLAEI